MIKYVVYFGGKSSIAIRAATFTEAAVKAVQKYPRRTVTKIVRAKDGRTVVTNW